MLHAALQTLAILLIWIGATFAYLSHTLKEPTTIPNFYSALSYHFSRLYEDMLSGPKNSTLPHVCAGTHSWLGISTITLATAQVRQ